MYEEESLESLESGELEGGKGDLLLLLECLPHSPFLLSFEGSALGLTLGLCLLAAHIEEQGTHRFQGATFEEFSSLLLSLFVVLALLGDSSFLMGMRLFERKRA